MQRSRDVRALHNINFTVVDVGMRLCVLTELQPRLRLRRQIRIHQFHTAPEDEYSRRLIWSPPV